MSELNAFPELQIEFLDDDYLLGNSNCYSLLLSFSVSLWYISIDSTKDNIIYIQQMMQKHFEVFVVVVTSFLSPLWAAG